MFHPDAHISRQLVREHHSRLEREWGSANPGRSRVVESRRRHRRLRLSWLRTQLRPASHTP